MNPQNVLRDTDTEELNELLIQSKMLTPTKLHPLQAQYIAQQLHVFDHEEDMMATLLNINQAMDRLAECTTLSVPENLRAALVTDIRLMGRIFNLFHSLKARAFILPATFSPMVLNLVELN